MDPVEITAGRLHLRPWEPADAPAVHAACQDPEIQRWTRVPVPYAMRDAETFVGEVSPREWAAGTGALFAVLDATDGRLLAALALADIADGAADVAFWAVAAERGRGVVPEAVGVVCRWGFAALALQRISWHAQVGNTASRRVAEKAGFTVEGTLRSALVLRGRRVDVWVGSLLPTDPAAGRDVS